MAKRARRRKKKGNGWKVLGKIIVVLAKIIWFIIKIPYYIVRGIYRLVRKVEEKTETMKIEHKREAIAPVYEDFSVVETKSGDYKLWEKTLFESESKIGIIIGARGSGKTAFGVKLIENIFAKTKKKCYALGFHREDFPSWIEVVDNISEIKNDSFALIDEGGILFSSRNSMSEANKILSELILVARHKNLNIIFISQNSSNLEVNILRQADYLVLKPSSLLQKDFERKIIQKIYEKNSLEFEKYKDTKGLTYIYSGEFEGFVANKLPSFWKSAISKSFK